MHVYPRVLYQDRPWADRALRCVALRTGPQVLLEPLAESVATSSGAAVGAFEDASAVSDVGATLLLSSAT